MKAFQKICFNNDLTSLKDLIHTAFQTQIKKQSSNITSILKGQI